MASFPLASLLPAAAVAAFLSGAVRADNAATPIQPGEGIFVDGKTLQIVIGKARHDDVSQIKRVNARELGPGVIIFRSGNKLYIADSPPLVQNAPGGPPTAIAAPPAGTPAPTTGTAVPQPGMTIRPEDMRPNRVRVEYVPPSNPAHQQLYGLLREHRVLEILQQVYSPFRLPFDLTLKTLGCGMVNAWYQREEYRPVINICYEYLDDILRRLPKDTTAANITPMDAAVGQLVFVTSHEFAHALFDLYHVPVLGREEDAADQIAAYIMLQFGKDRALRLIRGAAYSYREFIKDYKSNPGVTLPLAAFSSNHGMPEERFFNLLCMAYGADPQLFAQFVDNDYLPKTRAKTCNYEYRSLTNAFRDQISPHIEQQIAARVLDTRWLADRRGK